MRIGVLHPVESVWMYMGPDDRTRDIREEMDEDEVLEKERDLEIRKKDGLRSDNLFYQMRRDHTCRWLFIFRAALINSGADGEHCRDITIVEKEYDPGKRMPVDAGTSVIRDITFKNITIETGEGHAVYLGGLPESPARNIRLENIKARGKYGLYAENVSGLHLHAVTAEAESGSDLSMKAVDHVTMD